jgi:hypothetical protein
LNELTKALVALVFRVRLVLAAENVRTREIRMNIHSPHGGFSSSGRFCAVAFATSRSSIAGRWCGGEEQIVNASAAVLERGGSRLCVCVDPIRCCHGIANDNVVVVVVVVVVVSECVMLIRDGFVSKQFSLQTKVAIHPRLELRQTHNS